MGILTCQDMNIYVNIKIELLIHLWDIIAVNNGEGILPHIC